MIKNQIIDGTCIDYTFDGQGVIKHDAFCVFVKDMIKGEKGQIIITAVKKDYAYGKLMNLTEASEQRVQPICPISKPCGGCQLQHMSAKEQAWFKYHFVSETLKRIGHLDVEVQPVMTMKNPWKYRNKVQLPVGLDKNGNLVFGFYRLNSHDIIPLDNCALQSDHANHLLTVLKKLIVKYNLQKEVRHIMIRDLQATSQMMVVFVTYHKKVDGLKQLAQQLVTEDETIKSVIHNVNGDDTNVVLGKENIVLYGSEYIEDILCGLKFELSVNSFYQVNAYQTANLYEKAISLAQISKQDTVLDLYCGVGTIGLIASKYAKEVVGVEIVEKAIEDAKRNAQANDIHNITFYASDSQKIAEKFAREGKHMDVVIVDPPRKGCSSETLQSIVTIAPNRLVYVSCNPSTLARDLSYLNQFYEIRLVQPVDMFPQTHHCETIALLVRK